MRCAWASIEAAPVSYGSPQAHRAAAVPGMNCAIPCAPAPRARERVEARTRGRAGPRAASPKTLHRWAARASTGPKRSGTNPGSPPRAAAVAAGPGPPLATGR